MSLSSLAISSATSFFFFLSPLVAVFFKACILAVDANKSFNHESIYIKTT